MSVVLQNPIRICLSNFTRRNSTTTVSSAQFTSYFWRNDQWSAALRRRSSQRKLLSQAVAAEHAYDPLFPSSSSTVLNSLALPSSYPPPLSSLPYKPIPALTLPRLLGIYAKLSKSRLSVLVVLTAMSSVALSPLPTTVPVLLATALGTALCSASANTLNQLQEIPYDAQMARTRGRPLVRRVISPLHAAGFALVTGIAGPGLLWVCVNPTTAALGAVNIALYAGVYTYLKRRSIVNTWVGAVVGGLPPLMGWTACGGHLLPSTAYPTHLFLPPFLLSSSASPLSATLADNPLSALALFILLFSWQFPHFNSLSFIVRGSYAQAGYRMLSVVSPTQNALVALRHAALLMPVCSIFFPLSGLTDWAFALTSLLPNVICVRHAWAFWRVGGNGEKEARKVFNASLWYLPVVMGLMMLHKNGLEWTEWFAEKEDKKGQENEERTAELQLTR
ncbi:hypothetical protein EW145_g5678 [Phellinidium pouzarii]|uniref:Protoheme IX farnesyltransferase, mitochondrial n=1 Tax=Phellinidium pouzarii TaxID=167371 RepID=A0A4S4KZA8_9AGAM|nr:hypothetical protein EW145_g5678 [Phellinidium pouzarii]